MRWLVIEQTASFRDIRMRMAHVASAKVAVKWFEFPKVWKLWQQTLPKHFKELIQGRAFANSHIEALIDCLDIFRGCGEQVGLNSVGYITKIAARFPVSIDVALVCGDRVRNGSRYRT